MGYCTNCGTALGAGRFCTGCGQPVPERPAAPPAAPPTSPPPVRGPGVDPAPRVGSVPPPPRYPLFADSVGTAPRTAPRPEPPIAAAPARHRGGAPRRLPWVAVVALLVGVATLGGVLLLRDDDRPDDASATTRDDRNRGASGGEFVDAPADGSDLTGQASASAPATAQPSTDRLGNRVTFGAGNVLDGDPHTCWRMAGDGSGRALTFRFDAPVVLTAVGLVNGYAKVDGREDWYAANRRVLAVEWLFDDGTTVTQDLDEVRDLQTIAVDPVEVTTVRLRILEVSRPGPGGQGRDFTPISDVTLAGAPA